MSLSHSPKIVTDGLVFAYDMANTKKSWKGAPTTNLLSTGTSGYTAFTPSGWSTTMPQVGTSEFGTPIFKYDTTLVQYVYTHDNVLSDDFGTLSGQVGTFSLYLRRIEGPATSRIRMYDNVSSYSYSAAIAATTEFTKFEMNKTFGISPTRIFVMIDNTGGGTYEFHSPQVELGAYATPFVNGTRSNSQAIVDLTGNTTVTANSLTYNSDGTFSFASSLLDTTIGSGRNVASNPITIQAFVKSNTTSGARMWIDGGGGGTNQRLYSTLNAVGQSSGMGIQSSAWNSSALIDTNWHYQAIVLDGSIATAYDNGVVASSKAYTSYTLPGNIIVGGRSGYYWSGEISAFSIYDRALTAAEIQQNFNALRGRYGI